MSTLEWRKEQNEPLRNTTAIESMRNWYRGCINKIQWDKNNREEELETESKKLHEEILGIILLLPDIWVPEVIDRLIHDLQEVNKHPIKKRKGKLEKFEKQMNGVIEVYLMIPIFKNLKSNMAENYTQELKNNSQISGGWFYRNCESLLLKI